MANSTINAQFSKELGKQSRERLYTKEELQQLKIEKDLTPEEVKNLRTARKYCDSSRFTKNRANRTELIKSCMLMVVKVARDYWWATGKHNVPLDDVIQAGNLGLTIAADNYLNASLPSNVRVAKFSTYAYPWIKKYVLDELNLTSQQLSTGTRAAYENRLKGLVFQSKDDTMPGKEGDYESLVNNDLKSDFKTGQDILEIEQKHKQYTTIMQRAFSQLTSQEKTILQESYGLGVQDAMSLQEIANKHGLSTSGVHAIIKRCHHKIYWALSENERDVMAHFDTTAGLDIRALLCDGSEQQI